MHRIGIFQGRLVDDENGEIQSFPKSNWKAELEIAKSNHFNLIEWVIDNYYKKNPILSGEGISLIERCIDRLDNQILIHSVCCDFLMNYPLLIDTKSNQKMLDIINYLIDVSSERLHIQYIELPLIKASRLSVNHYEAFSNFILCIDNKLKLKNIGIAIEVDLKPNRVYDLCENYLKGTNCFINYDVGNSAYWGYNMIEELELYGKYIKTIHIKDCTPELYSVDLGKGNVDFKSFFKKLKEIKFKGDFILQTARGKDHIDTAIKHRKFVNSYIRKYLI